MKKTFIMLIMTMVALFAVMPGVASAQGQYVDKSIGVDISYPNGSAIIPNVSFGIVGVNGGMNFKSNPYLKTEASHFQNLSLYVNTGYPGDSYTIARGFQNTPNNCSLTDLNCLAYNYGYNAGLYSVAYAQSQGISSATWWLDVEIANSWLSDYTQNIQSLQGEMDAIKASGVSTIGIYSTTYQWGNITGGWLNNLPSWGATTWTTSKQTLTYCTGHQFTGGPSYLMQYKPKSSNIDYDVACPVATGGKTKPGH